MRATTIGLLLPLLMVSSCTGRAAPGGGGETFSADLATHRQVGPSPRTVELTDPVFRIGGSDAPETSAFGTVYGVLLDRESRLWVADRYAASISRFDAHGAFVDRIGRKGEGPGEFGWVRLVGWVGDSAAAWDGDDRRITMIPEEGGDPVPGPSGFGPRIVFGVGPSRLQVYVNPMKSGIRGDGQKGWVPVGSAFYLEAQAIATDSPRVVLTLRPLEVYFQDGNAKYDPFGYAGRPVVFNDTVVAAGKVDADILIRPLAGGPPVAFDLESEPGTPFTSELRARFARYAATDPGYSGNFVAPAVLSERGYPDRIPTFDRIVVSRAGVLWLRHWEDAWSRDKAHWEVVTIAGHHLGTALLPASELVVAANAHRVATLSHDENGAAVLTEYEHPFARK